MSTFDPNLSILPPHQRALWSELSAVPPHFVLYGGTAIAPRDLRVNSPLANIPKFMTALEIMPGEPMCRPENLRVRIW